MQNPLGCIFTLIFGVFLIVFGILKGFIRIFLEKSPKNGISFNFERADFSSNRRRKTGKTQGTGSRKEADRPGNATHKGHDDPRSKGEGKIFENHEGEYVDFEEV